MLTPMRTLCIVPRWGGTPTSDFYPWLERTLRAQKRRPFEEIATLDMPAPETPIVRDWVWEVDDAIGDDPHRAGQRVLVGHSVGAMAVMHGLANLPQGMPVAGAVLVAGWFWVDKPWDTLRPWLDAPLDLAAVRRGCRKMTVLLSDNDPFTADVEANRRAFQERLGADVRVVPGRNHFNAQEEPAVLEALLEPFP